MTDPTLTLAVVVAVGLAIVFFVKWRTSTPLALRIERNRLARRLEQLESSYRGSRWHNDQLIADNARLEHEIDSLKGRLEDTEAALHAKVAAEVRKPLLDEVLGPVASDETVPNIEALSDADLKALTESDEGPAETRGGDGEGPVAA